MIRSFFLTFYLTSIISLQGCAFERDNAGAPLAQITYEHVDPIILNVGSYNVIDQSSVELDIMIDNNGFSPNPLRSTKDYFESRFIASDTGATRLDVFIRDVEISHSRFYDDTPLSALFGSNDQYDIVVTVRLKTQNGIGNISSMDFVAKRSVIIPSHFAVIEREAAQQKAMDHLIRDIDVTVKNSFKNDLYLLH